MIQRMIWAARLDVHTYEEIEGDKAATVQAFLVVFIVAIASGIGGLIAASMSETDPNVGFGFIGGILAALVGWVIWAGVTYFVGTTILKTTETHADWGELARTTGFAQSPGVLNIFGFVPVLGVILSLVVGVWQIVAMVIAVRQSLDFTSTLRAVGVVLIGFVASLVVAAIIAAIVGVDVGLGGMTQ